MCAPLVAALPMIMAATSAGAAGAQSIFGFLGQNAAAAANERSANLAYAQASNEAGQEAVQVDQRQSENTVNAIIQSVAQRGKISASASSLGSGGETVAAESNAADFEAGRWLSVQDQNSTNQRLQITNQLKGADLQRRGQIMSVQPASPLSLVMGLAGAALKGANAYAGFGGRFAGNTGGGGSGGASASDVADLVQSGGATGAAL